MSENKRIGEVLVELGDVTKNTRDHALYLQEKSPTHRLLGHILVELKAIPYSRLLTVLSDKLHIPRAEALLRDRAALKEALGLYPAEEAEPKPAAPLSSAVAMDKAKPATEKKGRPVEKVELQLSKIQLPFMDVDTFNYLPESQGDIKQIAFMAIEMLRMNEFEEAMLLIDEGAQAAASSVHLKWLAIWAQIEQKHLQKARKMIDQIDATDMQNPAFASMKCYLLIDRGEFEAVLPELSKLTGMPKNETVWNLWLGYALAHSGHSAHAMLNYQAYLKKEPQDTKYTRFARKQMKELNG